MDSDQIKDFTKKLLSEEIFLCCLCKNVLTPPITMVKDLGNVCNPCFDLHKKTEWIFLLNAEMNQIFKELKFPCKYEPYGCDFATTHSELENHHDKCVFRSINCLLQPECEWFGKLEEYAKHFKDEHPKHVVHSPNDCFSFEYSFNKTRNLVKLLTNRNKMYILKITEVTQNGHVFLLHFIRDMDSTTKELSLMLSCVGKKGRYKIITKRLPLGSKDDETNGTKISIYTLQEIAEENGNIEVIIKPCRYMLKDLNEEITKQLECPVCKETMRPPINQCSRGHNFCSDCRPQLKDCPTCRQALSEARNFALEDITPLIYYLCTYNQFGCEESLLGSDIDHHEGVCRFKMYTCPITKCNFSGYYLATKAHFESNHRGELCESNIFQENFVQNYNTPKYETVRYFFKDSNIYSLTFTRTNTNCTWVVRILNKCDEKEKYFYIVTIIHPVIAQRKLMKSNLCLNAKTAVTESNIIQFTYNDLASYKNTSNSEQMVYSCEILKFQS